MSKKAAIAVIAFACLAGGVLLIMFARGEAVPVRLAKEAEAKAPSRLRLMPLLLIEWDWKLTNDGEPPREPSPAIAELLRVRTLPQ